MDASLHCNWYMAITSRSGQKINTKSVLFLTAVPGHSEGLLIDFVAFVNCNNVNIVCLSYSIHKEQMLVLMWPHM